MNAERVKELRALLGLTQKELAEKIGVSLKTITNYETGGVIPDSKQQLLLSLKKEASKITTIEETPEIKAVSKDMTMTKLIPLLPISAQGGSLDEFVMSVKEKNCEKIISPIKEATFAITIAGDSMAPEYPSGSQVLIKRIDEEAFIEWGRVYVLDTCNGVVVKRIIPSEQEDCIKCVSDNNALIYAPFDVRKTDIYGIYRVMLSMSIK